MMSIRTNARQSICLCVTAAFLAGCGSTIPLPLAAGNPADAEVRVPAKLPNNLLVHDETTLAIQQELSPSESRAKSAESMQHMGNGDMPGMQHGDMKMEDHKGMPSGMDVESEKKVVADEMKKISKEMKKTSEEMKGKSEQTKSQDFYYTCRMHPQIHADKPGKCPICGMILIKKEGAGPK
jgi:rubrerythrin